MSDDTTPRIEEQLARLQEQIRAAMQQRALLVKADADLTTIDTELARLREQRQRLQDKRLHQQRGAAPNEPTASTDRFPSVPPPAAPKRRPSRAQARPPFALRLLTILLVFGAIALVTVGALLFAAERFLVPPPVEGVTETDAGDDLAPQPGQSLQQRLLSLYLAANRDAINTPPGDDPTPVTFTIESGETAGAIAQRLEAEGLVTDAELFRRLLQYRGADATVEAGVYELARDMTMDEIIQALQRGRAEEVTFTFPEGWRAAQMADLLQAQGIVSAQDYMALVNDPTRFDYDFLRDLPPGSTLEGYLFPDTYTVIPAETSAESIISMQLETFGTRVTPDLRASAAARGMTLQQALTLASIVEREAVVSQERPTIAGVFINRWEDGILLNADPTIQYALGLQAETGDWWKRPLTSEDLQLDSPYNTYTRPGLPPGPISNPGLDSIRATILAPDTEYYYFVSRNDGTHVFATTLEEHIENVQQYQSGN
jgi:UPF0755 protein